MSGSEIEISAGSGLGASGQALLTREQHEVQGMMIMARRFPRDEGRALKRIESACADIDLANMAMYSYPKGGTTVDGPSIRLLEVISQNWGNMQQGLKFVNVGATQSEIVAFAWDLETNTRHAIEFTVPHWRDVKVSEKNPAGGYAITEQREIYELAANMGSRRLRKCLETIIPNHVIKAAVRAIKATIEGAGGIAERTEELVKAFAPMDVTVDDLEKRLGKKIHAVSNPEIHQLRKIYASIRDGMTNRNDWFDAIVDPGKFKEATSAAPRQDTPIDKADKAKVNLGAKQDFDNAVARVRLRGANPFAMIRMTEEAAQKLELSKLQAAADILNDWADKEEKV
jgi:hypothetical protein